MNEVIFIGGVHGVGKTTLCNRILEKIDINHYSASHLIKQLNKGSLNDKGKVVTDVNKNQGKLITAINNYVDKTKTYLLDGHFCLLDPDFHVVRISKKTFDEINPSGIVVIYDDIKNIQIKNSNRDSVNYDDKLLTHFQEEELEYSKYIASRLKVPYVRFNINAEISVVIDFIKNSIRKKL